MRLTLHVWRQAGPDKPGRMETYDAPGISDHMSFLEMLDLVNERMIEEGKEPFAFDSDCREGICGACGLVINGIPHGPHQTTTCQLHMRSFKDGEEIWIEPWRATAFPILKDLIVDREPFERIMQAGGYVAANAGGAPDGNAIPIPKPQADRAMDAAECIGCGACVAACPNASAMLFTSAKVSQFALLPQGQPERWERVHKMVSQMEQEGFGNCANHTECEAACPKGVSISFIAQLNRDLLRATLKKSGSAA
ncbi:MAG: succinate dehydrogenase/fumarate reductase iron-sulfur subunit [Deltaproteobacteria bacterium]|nr:succinate dehydrogenase/fumarate reductase iron-sulfur subunit [Deltaproteobacteria bacterium]